MILINTNSRQTVTIMNGTKHTFDLEKLREGHLYEQMLKNIKLGEKSTPHTGIDLEAADVVRLLGELWEQCVVDVEGYFYESAGERLPITELSEWRQYIFPSDKIESVMPLVELILPRAEKN